METVFVNQYLLSKLLFERLFIFIYFLFFRPNRDKWPLAINPDQPVN